VLAVVFAHAGLPGFAGGFIGVDIFFVISGFLITRLLLDEHARAGRIDIIAFWARRARRLLPNAYAALLGTLLLALFLFPGYDPAALSREIAFSALQIVNYHFAERAVDYFQADSPASPVLHFWSLAVEEQFYILWPLLLVGVGVLFRQSPIRTAAILLALIWFASFAASVVLTASDQPLAYFGLGTRCWQLATGALLVFGWQRIERLPARLRIPLAWGGLAAIFIGIAIIEEGQSYPGFWALIPTLGTASLLAGFGAAQPSGPMRRILSLPAMQWLGARSYSWYLWHWPLLALPRIAYPDSAYIEVIAVPASLALACAAYTWVEMPVRRGRVFHLTPWQTLGTAATALVSITGAGALYEPLLLSVDKATGARVAWIAAASHDRNQAEKDGCLTGEYEAAQPDCLYGDTSGRYRAVLFGDSHAAHWFEPLNHAAKRTGWQLRVRTKGSCPSANVLRKRGGIHSACNRWREDVMERLTGPQHPDLVIISNRTTVDRSGAIYDPASKDLLLDDAAADAWKDGLRDTIAKLIHTGVEVLLIRDIPRMEKNYKSCLLGGGACPTPRRRAVDRYPPLDLHVANGFAERIFFADFTDVFCTSQECPANHNGMIAYRDYNHLTATYAATFMPHMSGYFHAAAARLSGTRPAGAGRTMGADLLPGAMPQIGAATVKGSR
jgi:peptidoglycan/LPS O-acetylase OafA/YrhL